MFYSPTRSMGLEANRPLKLKHVPVCPQTTIKVKQNGIEYETDIE